MINRTRYRNLLTDSQEAEQANHLEPQADSNAVERLIVQVLTDQRGVTQSDTEHVRLMKALADAIFECWKAYRQRHVPSALSKNTHTRSRMRQHYYPSHSR